jgi:hypothetical protein
MPTDPIETAKLSAARSLVELVWDTPSIPQTFDIEYEGSSRALAAVLRGRGCSLVRLSSLSLDVPNRVKE